VTDADKKDKTDKSGSGQTQGQPVSFDAEQLLATAIF